jgi:predicted nucleotidyltransferase
MMTLLTAEALAGYRRGWQEREKARRARQEATRQTALTAAREAILSVAGDWPSIQRVYLFGSVIQVGAFSGRSDIDVAIEGATAEEYFGFWRELDAALPQWFVDAREIDLPSSFADEVRRTGVLIYDREDSPA